MGIESLTNGIARRKTQNDSLEGKSNGKQPFWSRVCLFEVDDFAAAAVGKVGSKFEVDGKGSGRHDEADNPEDECETGIGSV